MRNHYQDFLQLLDKGSLKKVMNGVRLLGSYYLSKWSKQNIHGGMPISVAFEPTTSCNLRCPECPSGLRSFSRPTGMLSASFFQEKIDELAPYLLYLTFYFQGEPYLHPNFLEMVSYANKKKIYTATSTNAHYLSSEQAKKTVESGLNRLIISIDGTTQETYSAYRVGGKLHKVIEGTREVVRWKKQLNSPTPHIIFQFLVVRPNEHQIEEVHQLAKELGVNEVKLKTAQIYDYEQGSPLIPTLDQYSRYAKKNDSTYQIKNPLDHSCWKMWHSCVITWDGKIVPCCFDKDAHHQLGDLSQKRFREEWKSPAYQKFRQQLLKGRSQIEICKNCTEGTKVFV
ncbi:SPASM domain-containing protein [Algivirga pacifica]|uniref:SPASM domain-containing protein n=1 Tax=Algivirga pacifica TaxID=1162670 RepID=UPI003CD0A9F0